MSTRDKIIHERNEIYDTICNTLREYEHPDEVIEKWGKPYSESEQNQIFYDLLINIVNNWEEILTADIIEIN